MVQKRPNSRSVTEKQRESRCMKTLISKQKWKELRKALAAVDNITKETCGTPCNKKCVTPHSFLHYACKFRPPLFIIQDLAEANPKAAMQKDCMERYPLHIAAKHGASVDIMSYLLQRNPDAAGAQDRKGKTPLHMLFHEYQWKIQPGVGGGREIRESMSRIVEMLFRAAPMSVIIEDAKGLSVIESAIEEDAPFKIVRGLQKASESVRKGSFQTFNFAKVKAEKQESSPALNHDKHKSKSKAVRRNSIVVIAAEVFDKKEFGSRVA